jgi:hypothetical protein
VRRFSSAENDEGIPNRKTQNYMKKLMLTAALSAATAVSGFSQGQIFFQNAGANSALFINGNKATAGTLASQGLVGTGVIDVGLYWSTQAFTDAAQGTLADNRDHEHDDGWRNRRR